MKNSLVPSKSRNHSFISRLISPSEHTINSTYELAEYDAYRDKLRTTLFHQAMENTAFLSSAEEHFLRIAPGGKDEYRLIVRAYAHKAIYEIINGDW